MKYKNLILAIISVFALTFNAEASGKKFKVLFVIPPIADTLLASETKSYIARELRELQDVEQIGKGPDLDYFFISIVPIALKLSNGQSAGVAVSYVIEKDMKIEHNVLVGTPTELKTLCEKIIAYFDTYWLQPERKRVR
jgi:hypothetical protein